MWFSFLIGGQDSSPALVLDVLGTRRADKVMGKNLFKLTDFL